MRFVKSTAGSGVERKRKRKRVHRHSSGSEGGADSGSDAEWNDEDNNAYLDFLKDFFFSPDKSKTHEVNDDEEADPEYSIKDDEEEHDKEELRADPAVKISKKELMELLAELGNEECDFPCVPSKPSDQVIVGGAEASDVKDVSVMVTATDIIGIHQPGCVAQEENNNEYLIPEITRDKIKYQLQQHIQLLAQTYALTVISPIEEDRMLARESKKMIIELNSYAMSYGPLTSFRVKNIHHAANLVNTWPAPVVSKSPIKKKILEERYRSQQRLIYGGNGLLFCREVVKKIAESPVFMYPLLLPTYPNLHSDYKVIFTSNEDALIAIGYHAMQEKLYEGLKTRQKAKLIAELLLPGRHAKQIFHRIKNARKVDKHVKNENLGIKILRKYLLEGVKPPSPLDSWSQDLMQVEPIPPIDQPKLPPTWLSLLTKLRLEIFDETVTNLPVKRSRKKNMKVSEVEFKPKATRSSSSKSKVRLNENKLCGSGIVIPDIPVQGQEETSEETERIPVYGPSGTTPAAFIVIAKKFLPKTSTEKKDANNNSDSSTDLRKGEVLSATPIGEPFSLPKSFSPESERGLGSVIDLQTIDSPLKREIFQMAASSSDDNKKKAPPQPLRPRKKTTDNQESTTTATKKRKQATKSVESQSVSVAKKPKEETTSVSDCSLNTSRGPREDHAARTWIYERKSAAEIAATIERKMKGKKKSRSKKAGTGSASAPDMNVKVSESSDDDERALPGASAKSLVGMSVPSLDIEVEPAVRQESQSRTPTDGRDILPRQDSQPRPNQAAPTNSNNEQQQRTDGSSNSQASDKSGSGKSTGSSSRSSRGVKRERGGGKQAAGDGDGDEDPPERPRVPLSKATTEDDVERRDEDSEEEGEEKDSPDTNTANKAVAAKTTTTTNVSRKSTAESAPKNPKKFKRSPQTKKRIPKYKTEQIQKLLDEADSEVNVEEIENAFAEEFWAKCQHSLDPVLYNNLVQVFCDFGEKNTSEDEVFTKVEEMLKDHPDLLIDLATMIEPQLLQKNNLLKDNYVIQAYIRFMHLLEKLTLQCPQLRARVLQKLRGLRDLEKVTEQDVQELVDLYFQGNPIMTDALKAMFPAIFPPQSAVHPEDFEEINFDDENLNQSEEGMAIETVVLPEETNVPATSTCPCDCHSNAQNMTFHTKVRHCQKCCIKFQDGKVFLHSGRFMKQVNIEFTTREKAEEILSGVSCGHCFESLKTTPKSISSPKRLPKKRGSRARVNISECDSESEVKQSTSGLKLKVTEVPKTDLQPPTDTRDTAIAAAAIKPKIESEDLEEGEIADEDDPPNNEPNREANSRLPLVQTTFKPLTPLSSIALNSRPATIITGPSEQSSNAKEWNFNDDEILLQTCQQEGPLPSTFEKLVRSKILPGRTVEEVQERFNELVKMIKIVQDQEKKACR